MAVSLRSHEVSDLCIGKPALKSLPLSATAGDALLALKKGGDTCLGVSAADRSSPERKLIAGKLCVVDILCFLCVDENLDSPVDALKKPISDLLSKDAALVRRVESHSRYPLPPSFRILEIDNNLLILMVSCFTS